MYISVYRLLIWTHLVYRCVVAIESSPFLKTLTSAAMIDKTLLIKQIFEDPVRYRIITCPHGFGKTTNMDMIRRFVQVSMDQQYNIIVDKKHSRNFKLFFDSNHNFDIAKEEKIVNQHYSEYLTLVMDFSIEKVQSYQDVIAQIGHKIRQLFEQYRWFYRKNLAGNAGSDWPKTKALFDRIYEDTATEDDFVVSLQTLAEVISMEYGKKRVFLLIDNFDTPIMKALAAGAESLRVVRFLRRMLLAVITATPAHVRRAVMYGLSGMMATAVASEDLKLVHQNLVYNRFLDAHKLNTYCGFTDIEVAQLCDRYNVPREDRNRLEKYYDGYCSEEKTPHIYIPSSVVTYFGERGQQNATSGPSAINKYWSRTTLGLSIAKCMKHLYMRDLYNELILSKKMHHNWPQPILAEVDERFPQLEIMFHPTNDSTDFLPLFYFAHMYELGYLSYFDCYGNLQIPNLEAQVILERYLNKYYVEVAGIPATKLHRIAASLQSISENYTTTRDMLEEVHDSLMDDDIVPYFYPTRESKYLRKGRQLDLCAMIYTALTVQGNQMFGKIVSKASVSMLINGRLNDTFERVTTVDLFITNRNRRAVLLVQVGFEDNIKRMIEHLTELTPRVGRKQPQLLKHMALNLRSKKIEIATAPTKQYSRGQWEDV